MPQHSSRLSVEEPEAEFLIDTHFIENTAVNDDERILNSTSDSDSKDDSKLLIDCQPVDRFVIL